MSKVVHLGKSGCVMCVKDIPIGTYFYGNISTYPEFNSHLFLRTYNGVVSIDNPHKTWDNVLFSITNFHMVDVTVTVNSLIS